MDYAQLKAAADFVRSKLPNAHPRAAIVLGSGWGPVCEIFKPAHEILYSEIPNFGAPQVAGHSGRLGIGELAGVRTLVFQGRRHWYEGAGWDPIAIPIAIMKTLGVEVVVLTNAAGGIQSGMAAGDLMMIEDHINLIPDNPLRGEHSDFFASRFPDMSSAYDRDLREAMLSTGVNTGILLKRGVLAAVQGPAFETPAEIRYLRAIGADAVGMSTAPEALLAHAAGMRVCGVSCISNLAAGLSHNTLTHAEVEKTLSQSMSRIRDFVENFWARLPQFVTQSNY